MAIRLKNVEHYKIKHFQKKLKTLKFLNFYLKIQIIEFGRTEKHKFYYHKNTILIDDININKVILSKKISFGKKGFKYFIG